MSAAERIEAARAERAFLRTEAATKGRSPAERERARVERFVRECERAAFGISPNRGMAREAARPDDEGMTTTPTERHPMTNATPAPCAHGTYYDCDHGCTPSHLAGDEVAVQAARRYRALRFDSRLTPEATSATVAREYGATLAEVGPLVGRGVGIMGRSRD